uniref:Uncharacterized protein n=1 Tax=Anguilla anguilla TaxID=7936 RepID=A0A0E9TDE3_ANGAN
MLNQIMTIMCLLKHKLLLEPGIMAQACLHSYSPPALHRSVTH